MIKFINLNNGAIYDGNVPYIHKFDGEQSVNLIYTLCLCVISNQKKLNISIKKNEVFSLLDNSKLIVPDISKDIINDVKYVELDKCKVNNLILTGQKYNNQYIYAIYFSAESDFVGEYIEEFQINQQVFKIGADFYQENESLKINLNNFGQEIPESIQKAIYPTNVREDKLDYITLNRKWKELLSNYWDVIANKGSYKSLENSLKWFEYGDLIKIEEFWKHVDFNKNIYDNRSLNSIIIDKYEGFLKGFYKTSYISLCLALQKLNKSDNGVTKYDQEQNPRLKQIISKWSIHDLMLKMSLLGNFYETYFMPIHLDLIRSTIEDIVFTNTIKIINSISLDYEDSFNSFQSLNCNIKDGDVFYLKNISVQVGRETKLANRIKSKDNFTNIANPLYFAYDDDRNILYDDKRKIAIRYNINNNLYYDKDDYESQIKDWLLDQSKPKPKDLNYNNTAYIIGVDEEIESVLNDTDERTFWSQNYTGPGVMVKFNYEVVLAPDDYVKKETISYIPDDNISGKWMTKTMHDIFNQRKVVTIVKDNREELLTTNIVKIPFNLLCREAREYDIHLQLESANGLIFVKNIKFRVEDPMYNHLKLYKIQHLQYPNINGFENLDFINKHINDTIFGRIPSLPLINDNIYNLFIPANINSSYYNVLKWNGICLNHILILEGKYIFGGEKYNGTSISLKDYLEEKYLIFTKDTLLSYPEPERSGHLKERKYYTVCISRKFNYTPNINFILSQIKTDGKIYRNDYGYFSEFHKAIPIEGDDIQNYIITNNDTLCVAPNFKYGTDIKLNDYEWIFENVSTGEQIKLPISIREPFIANTKKDWLTPGYYNIIFKYSLTNDNNVHTIEWDSAFIKQ